MALLTVNDVHNATQALLKRDARTQLAPTPTQKVTLIVAGVYIVAIGILWYVILSSCYPCVYESINESIIHKACALPRETMWVIRLSPVQNS